MNHKNQFITLKESYDLIWKTPITKLERGNELPTDLLKRICTKLKISTPDSGYWMKLKFNKKVAIPKLPDFEDEETGLKIIEGKIIYKENNQSDFFLGLKRKLRKIMESFSFLKKNFQNNFLPQNSV